MAQKQAIFNSIWHMLRKIARENVHKLKYAAEIGLLILKAMHKLKFAAKNGTVAL